MGVSDLSAQYLIELSKMFKVTTDYLLGLNSKEMVDISYLGEDEKKLPYSLLDYFKKYGYIMRSINRQVEEQYDTIKKISEEISEDTVRNLLEDILEIVEPS